MIDDSERREIAARLMREACAWRETFPESECDFSDAAAMMQDLCVFVGLERNALCSEVFQRLADLIEPEPERTCKMIPFVEEDDSVFIVNCSECGDAIFARGGEHYCNFCPSCGAKVVE